jgi:putative toxin-antitoxin system antitoxin component (TIGR02293 family)
VTTAGAAVTLESDAMFDVNAIARLLGGRKVLGREPRSDADLVDAIRKGLPYESLETVSRRVGLTTLEEKSEVLGVPVRTLQRRADEGHLKPLESELTIRLARLAQRAEEVLEDTERAYRFLREPNEALGGKRPLDLVQTDIGTRMVEDVLNRIEFTVYG